MYFFYLYLIYYNTGARVLVQGKGLKGCWVIMFCCIPMACWVIKCSAVVLQGDPEERLKYIQQLSDQGGR